MNETFSNLGFVRRYILPAFLILAIPAFSWWFFGYATRSLDARYEKQILESISKDKDVSPEQREEARQFFDKHPVSEILTSTDPRLVAIQPKLQSVSDEYTHFRLARTVSLACIGLTGAVLLLGLVSVGLSLRSQAFQYYSLAFFWHTLKIVVVLELVAQGLLAVALSYYVTVVLDNKYSPKLILCAVVVAGGAVVAVLAAMFKKIDETVQIEGELLEAGRAGALWTRIRDLAGQLATAPPDQIVVGIDDNFFVTEHEIDVTSPTRGTTTRCKGRTLFVSLPLLKTLERGEADAVLAHELAHFSGDDTLYSRRTSPILARYATYLESLHQGFGWPVFTFMLAFRSLFELSLRRTGRARELRADAHAARLTSPRALSHALLKIAAFSGYRQSVEETIFSRREVLDAARISAGIAEGFPAFISEGLSLEALGDAQTVHPFDSHPPLHERMDAVGIHLEPAQRESVLLTDVESSWHAAIEGVESLEGEMWAAYEKAFRDAHERSLAYRYLPVGDDETAIVERYFPPRTYNGPRGAVIELDFRGLTLSWESRPIPFTDIDKCTVDDNSGTPVTLKIEHHADGRTTTAKVDLRSLDGPFLDMFSAYWTRYQAAVHYTQTEVASGSRG